MAKKDAKSIAIFFSVAITMMSAVPALNVAMSGALRWDRSHLYNLDFALPWISGLLQPLGISVEPDQVIIGPDDWLHLGDQYRNTISDDRRQATADDVATATRLQNAAHEWDDALQSHGVRSYLIMVGPNKSSIYPETLPTWSRPALHNPTDALLSDPHQNYLDLRPALIAAKTSVDEPLYYRTDTHWNLLGAGFAFQALAKALGERDRTIEWPAPQSYGLNSSLSRGGGDLARFLHRENHMKDSEPDVAVMHGNMIVTQTNWRTGSLVYQGPNISIQSPAEPLRVHSTGALNERRVLWLRDSFGVALAPYMASTFSDVLQIHWDEGLKDGVLLDLVRSFRPEYVVVTVVQREARNEAFMTLPTPPS